MEPARNVPASEIRLRPVVDGDLELFFEHQADPLASELAGFEPRARDAFFAHWAKVRANPDGLLRAVLADGELVGNVASWGSDDERLVGYWIGREHWNRAIATRALAAFLALETRRPLFAHVVRGNVASRRVLAKCGFVEQPGEASAEELVYRLDGSRRTERADHATAAGDALAARDATSAGSEASEFEVEQAKEVTSPKSPPLASNPERTRCTPSAPAATRSTYVPTETNETNETNESRSLVRVARSDDIPGMHRIRMAVRENRLVTLVISPADYERELALTGRGWVAEVDGELVGFAIGNAIRGNVWALFVDPEHERSGHGRRLHDAMVAWLWSRGLERIWLTTDPGTRAERFYLAAGWRATGRVGNEVRYELERPK